MNLAQIKAAVQKRSREEKFRQFYASVPSPCAVLDVGVSKFDVHSRKDAANYFLKTFRFSAQYYTGLGINDMSGLSKLYPGKTFLTYDGEVFPFRDREFDAVFSNAVVEHVGDKNRQLLFINEMLRVGVFVFFTTPNKWFPIETHTSWFLIHWWESLFYRLSKRYDKNNLNLLSRNQISSLMHESEAKWWHISSNQFVGWPMTFTIKCSRYNADQH